MNFKQRQAEWVGRDVDYAYHTRQFEKPYSSTVQFADWLEDIGVFDQAARLQVLDVGCGAGANMHYFKQRFQQCAYTGVELNERLVSFGNQRMKQLAIANEVVLRCDDLYKLDPDVYGNTDCLLSLQTLSWLPDFRRPLELFCSLNPEWICLTSLFYDGPISCRIEVTEHDKKDPRSAQSFYNVYSLSEVVSCLRTLGYPEVYFQKFDIDIDLPRPENGGLGTYTERTQNGQRLQISGPLLMPWYFLAARRVAP